MANVQGFDRDDMREGNRPAEGEQELRHLDGTVISQVAHRQTRRHEQAQSLAFLDQTNRGGEIVVLLPCLNEETTIAKVVGDFRQVLPAATIYVYDNASTDGTAAAAAAAGAVVRLSPSGGKGDVLRRMFAEIDASVYVMADGDDTYDASAAPSMIDRLHRRRLDMVVGKRVEGGDSTRPYRRGHRSGNQFLSGVVHQLFGEESLDMLSGYRVLSRRYVKSFASFSSGFAIETEMTIHAMDLCLPCEEVPIAYQERPSGSESKLRTIPDGLKILSFLLILFKDYRPRQFFGGLALVSAAGAAALGAVALDDLSAGEATPASLACAGLGTVALISAVSGVILDSLGRGRREMKRMLYLATAPTLQFDVDRHAWSDAPPDS